MPLQTLWESICSLAGDDGLNEIQLRDAVERSAVPENVATVEVRRMVTDGLVELAGDESSLHLTDRGRRSCVDNLQSPARAGIVPPEQ